MFKVNQWTTTSKSDTYVQFSAVQWTLEHHKGLTNLLIQKWSGLSREHTLFMVELLEENIQNPPEFWNSVSYVDTIAYAVFGSDGKQMVW
ncbi:hypothetical protein AVEN_217476-1 [Araneus ventricosus]|uniref:Uncharacterized protein n=1 Tax=Araneus ventricosus TaxID=182803 RepID=A0A4Y2SDA1_ARAVE|nr:hypothetical protein AVEN_217476-1 [Araneus ventricosus]